MELYVLIGVSLFVAGCYSQGIAIHPMPVESQCGLNEQYTTCGSACPPTCADLRNKNGPAKMCIMMCKIGCECKRGFVLDKDGRCISEAECLADKIPTHCPSGLPELPGYNCGRSPQRRECPSTHYCEISPVDAYAVCCPNKRNAPIDHCAENECARDEKCIPAPKNCFTTPCPQYRCEKVKISTHCPSGLPEMQGYNCGRSPQRRECPSTHYCEISPVDAYAVCCPQKGNAPIDHCAENDCAKDEKCIPEPKNCFTTPCPQYRCEKADPRLPCPLVRCANQCKFGQKRDPKTGCYGCECNEECGSNQEFKVCGSCEQTCKTLGQPILCTKECRQECQCKAGYVRDEERNCVPENKCPNKCGSNEVFTQCGGCEPTCENYGRLVACPKICRLNTCQCASGYVRDANKRCILPRECPLRDEPIDACFHNNCKPNERCVPEPKNCITTPCDQYRCEAKPRDCPLFKCSGDICPNGFAMNKETGCQDGCKCDNTNSVCDPNPCKKDERCKPVRNVCKKEPCPQYICALKAVQPTQFPKCRRNEELRQCGACDNTCAQVRAGESNICTADCRPPACGCKHGYARDENKKCVSEKFCKKPDDVRQNKRDCRLKPEIGNCRAAILSFYYDPKSKSCKTFSWGGCGGNNNRFETEDDCMKKCGPRKKLIFSDKNNPLDACRQPKVVGRCKALFPSWYYNSESGQCEAFNYGGCGGNDNRFQTQADCQARCPPRKG